MPFVAQCPHCKVGQVRAPDHAAGLSATCPSCFSCFTLAPEIQPAVRATSAAPVTKTAAAVSPTATATQLKSPPDEPSPDIGMDEQDVNDEQPAVAPSPRPVFFPAFEPPEPTSGPVPIWLVALTLAGLALVAAQIPYGRIPALVLSGLGLAVGLFSVSVDDRRWRWPLAGAALSGLVLLVAAFLPTWLGMQPWGSRPEEVYAGPTFVEFRSGRNAIGAKPAPISESEWIDASRGAWQHGGARVYVTSVAIGSVELENAKGKVRSKDNRLIIGISLVNVGVARMFQFRPFEERVQPDNPPLRLQDSTGGPIEPRGFGSGWSIARKAKTKDVAPGGSVDDLLVFDTPKGRCEYLNLELPAASVGHPGVIRFRIPESMFANRTNGGQKIVP